MIKILLTILHQVNIEQRYIILNINEQTRIHEICIVQFLTYKNKTIICAYNMYFTCAYYIIYVDIHDIKV
jgi:hypothetical protein